MAESAQKR